MRTSRRPRRGRRPWHGGAAPGFENATIYANANAKNFRDVTQNGGVQTILPQSSSTAVVEVMGDDTSLQAKPGYDTATGLGSPTAAFLQAPYDANRVGRIAGGTRYETGIQISRQQFPGNGSANAVVLAVGIMAPAITIISNQLSRGVEQRADQFSLEIAPEPRTFIGFQKRIATTNVSDPDPPPVVRFLLGTHPSTIERIGLAERFER